MAAEADSLQWSKRPTDCAETHRRSNTVGPRSGNKCAACLSSGHARLSSRAYSRAREQSLDADQRTASSAPTGDARKKYA